jgi:hypothetical protein
MMNNTRQFQLGCCYGAIFVFALVLPAPTMAATLQAATLKTWETYVELTEKRIAQELNSTSGFLHTDFMNPSVAANVRDLLKSGRPYILKMSTRDQYGREIHAPDALIHHWFGSIFIPRVNVQSLIRWVQDYDQHQRYFSEVEQSKLISRDADTFRIFLRFVRKKVVTVHYNTNHTVIYRDHGNGRESSRSFTTRIAEIQDAGQASEVEKSIGDDSGYLWRLNSYWRFVNQDDGVIVECESLSLSRSIPFGLGWLIKGFVESVPRESLESMLVEIREGTAATGSRR